MNRVNSFLVVLFYVFPLIISYTTLQSKEVKLFQSDYVPRFEGDITPISIPILPEYKPVKEKGGQDEKKNES